MQQKRAQSTIRMQNNSQGTKSGVGNVAIVFQNNANNAQSSEKLE